MFRPLSRLLLDPNAPAPTSGGAPVEPQPAPNAPAPAPAADPQNTPAPDDDVLTGARQRIAGLTRQRAEAQSGRDQANAQLEQALERIAQLEGRVANTPANAPSNSGSLFPSASPQATPQPQDNESLIQRAVEAALTAVDTRSAERSQLENAQRQSFAEASQVVPGLARDGSPETTLFNEVWQARPELADRPDGPLVIAGLVAAALARPGAQPDNRSAASIGSPNLPGSPTNAGVGSPNQTAAQRAELLSALTQKGNTQGLSDDEMQLLIRLKEDEAYGPPGS